MRTLPRKTLRLVNSRTAGLAEGTLSTHTTISSIHLRRLLDYHKIPDATAYDGRVQIAGS